jgi:SAM-dependent methyltransferase
MMFFEQYKEFVDADPRKDRAMVQVNYETMTKRCEVSLPKWLIEGKSILDLGSCYGAYGQWALMNGAKNYTGVELQKQFADASIEMLSKYHTNFGVIQEDALQFLRNSSYLNEKYDIIIAAGLIHGYTDVVELLRLMSLVSEEYIIIESMEVDEPTYPRIEFKPYRMVVPKEKQDSTYRYSEGFTAIAGFKAVSFILYESGFVNDGGRLLPEKITTSLDAYNTPIADYKTNNFKDPATITVERYIGRFKKQETKPLSLQHNTITGNSNLLPKELKSKTISAFEPWKFDDSVAKRFQQEARTNIPDYERVLGLCLGVANKKFNKNISVIDVGSALGHTLDIFIKDGFKSVVGVDNSTEMINNSLHKQKVKYSDKLPKGNYDMVMANWTLHFVNERKEYIQDVYDNMNTGGVFILSEKTPQDETIKEMYYDFKRNNGITDEYIYEKEEKLKGYMNLLPIRWYLDTLELTGFKNIQIINSRFGFVTFYCEK